MSTTNTKEAGRLIDRRARALATERGRDLIAEGAAMNVRVTCGEAKGGGWFCEVTVTVGDRPVVRERATGDDPTAALLALPARLKAIIDATCARLALALREGPDVDVEEANAPAAGSVNLSVTVPTTTNSTTPFVLEPRTAPARRAKRAPATAAPTTCHGCGEPAGAPHTVSCQGDGASP